eukprot:Sdes_comp20283_c0_seq1m13857
MKYPLSYAQRGALCKNATASKLFRLMDEKKTNLSFSADVSTQAELLAIVDLVGPFICLLKTHIDILRDFDKELPSKLSVLAQKHNFLIFEDRKFADIGNTVQQQYGSGIYEIASWADIVNCHLVPGPGIVAGLADVGLPLGRGLLLLAEMSSEGNLATGKYSEQAIEWALKDDSNFVIGFISSGQLIAHDPRFLYMTPGVHIHQSGDKFGQVYKSPEFVICEKKSDIIIVGRGIYSDSNPAQAASEYRNAGWKAYKKRLETPML